MRVLIVSDITGWDVGGVPVELATLATLLHARGHAVAVLNDRPAGVPEAVSRFPLTIPLVAGRFAAELRRALDGFRPDVVHVMALGAGMLGALRATLGGLPWLLTVHNLPPFERRLGLAYRSPALHYLLRDMRFLPNTLQWMRVLRGGVVPMAVAHSPETGRRLRRYGQPPERVREIPIGVALPSGVASAGDVHERESGAAGRPVRTVSVGGLVFTKGHHDAVEAVARCRRLGLDVRHRIVGRVKQGNYLRHLRELMHRYRLDDAVSIETDVDEHAKRAMLAEADVYLQPSHEEGFCLAFVEAALQVPRLVGTTTGVMPLASRGDASMRVVRPGRPGELALAIAELAVSPVPAGWMARRRDRLASLLSPELYARRHEALYEELLGGVRQGAGRAS